MIREELFYKMIDISEWLSSRTSVDSKPTEITNALITIEKGRDSIFQATSKELETGLHSNVRESRSRDIKQKDDDDDDDYSDDDIDDEEKRDFSGSKKIRLNRGTTQHHEPVAELPSRRGLKNKKKEPQSSKAAAECLDLSGDVAVYIPQKKVGRPSKKKQAQRRDLLIRVGTWRGVEAVSTAPLSGKSRRESCLRPYSSVVINRQLKTMTSSSFRRKYEDLILTSAPTATFT